jgi:aryl-alcohol dehydrogenase-like predicted oxidoreductase
VTELRYRLLGRTGLRVSELFLGAMTFGDPDTVGTDPEECRRILDAYADAGGNVVDTAINYRGGASESILGERSRMRTPPSRKPSGRSTTSYATARSSTSASQTRLRGSSPTPTPLRPSTVGPHSQRSKRHTASCSATSKESFSRWTRVRHERRRLVAARRRPSSPASSRAKVGQGPEPGVSPGTLTERDLAVARSVDEIASEMGASASQVAIAWTRSTLERGASHHRGPPPRSAA